MQHKGILIGGGLVVLVAGYLYIKSKNATTAATAAATPTTVTVSPGVTGPNGYGNSSPGYGGGASYQNALSSEAALSKDLANLQSQRTPTAA